MALIFYEYLHVSLLPFQVSSLASHIASTLSPMMSGPGSPDLSSLDYQVWGNVGVLSQAAIEAKDGSPV